MNKNQKQILAQIKYLANTEYINDAQEMQDNLEVIHGLMNTAFPDIEESCETDND